MNFNPSMSSFFLWKVPKTPAINDKTCPGGMDPDPGFTGLNIICSVNLFALSS